MNQNLKNIRQFLHNLSLKALEKKKVFTKFFIAFVNNFEDENTISHFDFEKALERKNSPNVSIYAEDKGNKRLSQEGDLFEGVNDSRILLIIIFFLNYS